MCGVVWLCANLPAQTPPQNPSQLPRNRPTQARPHLGTSLLAEGGVESPTHKQKQQPTNQPNQLTHKSCVVEGGRLLCWFLVGLVYWFEFIADIPLLNQQPLPFFQLKPTTNKPLLQYPTQQRRNNNSTITNKYF